MKPQTRLREAAVVAVGRAAQMLVGLVSIRVLTTILSAGEAGRYFLILAAVNAVSMVMLTGPGTYLNRKFLDWRHEGRGLAFIRPYGAYLFGVAGGGAIVIWLAGQSGWINFGDDTWFVAAVALATLLGSTGVSILTSLLNLYRSRFAAVTVTLGSQVLGLGLAWWFVLNGNPTAAAWLAGAAGAHMMALPVAFFLLRRQSGHSPLSFGPRNTPWRQGARFAWPLAVSAGLFWVQTQSYRFVLERIAGAADLGVFAIGYSIGATMVISFELVFHQFYQPVFYQGLVGASPQARVRAWNAYARLYVPLVVLVFAFAASSPGFLTRLIAGPAFQEASRFVLWGALAESLRSTISAFAFAAQAEMRMDRLLGPTVTGAAVTLVALAAMAPILVEHGVGMALALGALGAAVHLGIRMGRAMRLELPWRRIAQAGGIGAALAVLNFAAWWTLGTDRFAVAILWLALSGAMLAGAGYLLYRRWGEVVRL